MSSLLNAILCWLQDFLPSLGDFLNASWESLLQVADGVLFTMPALPLPTLNSSVTWLLASAGVAPAIALIAGAYLIRFTLQSVPFVRWGS